MEQRVKSFCEILKNQDLILQKEHMLEEMKEMVMRLHKLAETNSLAKEHLTPSWITSINIHTRKSAPT